MPIIPTLQDKLFGDGGAPLNVRGSTRFRIGQVHIHALVTESMSGDLLLGWNDCRRLSIVPDNFPTPIKSWKYIVNHVTTEEEDLKDLRENYLKTYPNVLTDELPSSPMKGVPMVIQLHEDVPIRPLASTTTRPIPEQLASDANKLV